MTAKINTPDASTAEPQVAFEAALTELQEIVGKLETGSTTLEESMRQFERGVSLLKNCYRVLENAEQRIEILTGVDRDGTPQSQPFDASATFDAPDTQTPPTRKTKPRKPNNELPF